MLKVMKDCGSSLSHLLLGKYGYKDDEPGLKFTLKFCVALSAIFAQYECGGTS